MEDEPINRSRYTQEQIAFVLRQAENGMPMVEICREMDIAVQTFYRCKRGTSAWG